MISIRDFLNKIKWDKSLNQNDYKIIYFDNKLKKSFEIPFSAIKEIDKNFIVVEKDTKKIDIPLHTVREVRKEDKREDKLVWRRTIKN